MLKFQHKSLLLLLLFCFFLSEYLTWSTLALSVLGATLIYFNIKLPKLYRNLIVLGIFASYWLIYGKLIDPEVGLNFLTSVIVLKMLEKESRRDQYMIFFGLILLLSTGALFEKNLTYAAFYTLSFLVLIADFYQELLIRVRLKDLFISLLWVLPLTTVLFFMAPRMMNPLPFKSSAPQQGEVGYTPDVNLSEIDQLAANDEPVFQALVPAEISQSELYWRGNVLSYNDGWNWTGLQERIAPAKFDPQMKLTGLRQEIQLMGSQSYFFGLDRPNAFLYQGEVRFARGTHSLSQQSSRNILSYDVISNAQAAAPVIEERSANIKTMLSRQDREWIHSTFTAQTLEGVIREVQDYFRINRFTYSLSPGRTFNFQSFMQERRIGYCSHFASSLGLILRVKGYPTRLVSGFMGGRFNQYGSYYLITQNDAHAWAEVIQDGKWIRLDPTEWIAPDRIRLGGEAFAGANAPAGTLAALGFKFNFSWAQDIKLWFNQWDFRFYRWLDQMDYQGQLEFLSSLKIKRQWLYTIVPLIILSFAFLYMWQMARSKTHALTDLESLWQIYLKKAYARGLILNRVSIKEAEKQIQNLQHPDQGKLLSLFQKLLRLSFDKNETGSLKGLRNELKKF